MLPAYSGSAAPRKLTGIKLTVSIFVSALHSTAKLVRYHAAGVNGITCALSARLSASQAASERVSTNRLSKRTGITTVSVIVRDMEKSGGDHSTRRTAAIASLKVGSFFRYHAAAWGAEDATLGLGQFGGPDRD